MIIKRSEVKMAVKDLCRTPVDGVSRAIRSEHWLHYNKKKTERGQYPAILTEQATIVAWSTKDLL